MKLFMCFGGAAAAAAVIDDEAAEMAATHLKLKGQRRGRRSLSFRGKSFLPGKNNKGGNDGKKPSAAPQPLDQSKKRGMVDADDVAYGVSRASSVASSALLSASSLDSCTSASSSSPRSSTASSSPSVSGVLYPPPVKRRQASNNNNKRRAASSSPAAGAAAVVLCLLMVVFCGRVGATLLMSTALYLFQRRWPARTTREEKRGAVGSLECDAAAVSASEAEEEETAKRKVVAEGSLVRNRNKVK